METDRRRLIGVVAASIGLASGLKEVLAQEPSLTDPPLPNPATFQSGDLLWPKKPGQFVPYRSVIAADPVDDEEKRWLQERGEFITRARPGDTYLTSDELGTLETMSFREFYARYAGDQKPGIPGAYSSGNGIYVGHVAILSVDNENVVWVIEALWGKGVVRSSYADWLRLRPGEIVWQGRVRNLDPDQRRVIATESEKYIGRPYDFWNFDLNNADGFYCSKLVWLCIFRSLHFAIDGNSNPQRNFWFSPKQLLYAKTIARLFDPGPYAL
jgi:Permuted papain-like amidase enzyme, YaeF/YiiX, C92 family